MKEIATYVSHVQEGILLNANEYSANVSGELMVKIQAAVAQVMLNHYPDTSQEALLETYGKIIGLGKEMLLAGNGSDQMLGYLIGTYLGKGKTLFTLSPDFSMYDYYATSYEASVVRFATQEDGSFDVDRFIQAGKDAKASMIMFSNPNNPTGHLVTLPEVEKIALAFQEIPVVCDEAYVEFADQPSAVQILPAHANLFVTRTLSKAYGLAGLRVGFLCGNLEPMKELKASFVPYALNSVSMKIAETVLKEGEAADQRIALIKQEREVMLDYLKGCAKLQVFASQANFIYGKSMQKESLLAAFKHAGIVIRDYAGTEYFRITIGLPQENEAVRKVIAEFEGGK